MKQLNIKFLLALLISMLGVKASAHDIAVANDDGVTIYYNYINNKTELAVTYQGTSSQWYSNEYGGNVVIPESVTCYGKTYPVTSIGGAAFEYCKNLTSITIPNSVTSIGNSAFEDCSGLMSVTITNSVTSIGDNAFSNCSSLTSVAIPNSVSYIGCSAFEGSAWYKNQPNGLVYIGKVAYKYKGSMPSNTSIVLEEGTLGIAGGAFIWCNNLTSITIPNSVTSIGESAFQNCTGLTSIQVEEGNHKFDSRDGSNAIIETETNILIVGCKETVIPNSVTSIGNYAFCGCSSLTSITIPNSVTSIGEFAFRGCSGLTSITIPSSVTSIEPYTFWECSSLTSITIPDSLTNIGGLAFSGCTSLTSITIPNSVTSIGLQAFSGCTSLTSITIPNSVTCIGLQAFYGCSDLSSVTIPSSVTSIGEFAFVGCNNLLVVNSGILEPFNFRNVFSTNTLRNGTLYIPAGTKDLYARFDGWREFLRIEEVGGEQEQYVWLTIKDDRGSTMLKVKKGATQELAVKPEAGWKILMATMDGTDISAQIKNGNVYTTPAIMNDATINIIYEMDDPSGTFAARESKADINVVDDGVVISNAEPQSRCVVYSSSGQQVVNTVIEDGSRKITLQKGQVYILTINGRTLKFAL